MEPVSNLIMQRLAELDDAALREAYAPLAEPWLRVNFVSTLDGAITGADGSSKSINNEADHRVFMALRRQADCLVVGAGTVRDEGYQHPTLPLVLVSRSGEVPPTLRDAPRGSVLMATVASAPALDETRQLLGDDLVLVMGEDEVDFVALKEALAGRGWTNQLSEGGPQLFGAMAAAGVVDELCLTVVPRLVGGDHLRAMTGPDLDVGLRLHTLLEDGGTLLGRWVVGS